MDIRPHLKVMKDIMESPIGNVFNECFIPDGVTDLDYSTKFNDSIDLKTIKDNLIHNKYKTTTEWRNDVMKCFAQFKKLGEFSENPSITALAKFGEDKFIKKCTEYALLSYSQWFQESNRLDEKLNLLISSRLTQFKATNTPDKNLVKDIIKSAKLLTDQTKINNLYSLMQIFDITSNVSGQVILDTTCLTNNQILTIMNYLK
ncbi:hypothetical protein TVAG_402400 [Trichomonas vaginalis G3]|uniref:Bromo domain-containing protein n=1 Tax=Trichomonas vaginalis (strain ATCC PRA-98 / G3) TaxID=412133 RepID=A2DHZ6_TRIV3|nr:bromodomain family [Trichomonas vaginalis G3]EAY19985.1 hypothetical protein TVAG_402400 [Trichomonas vaginalis G3]KAI5525935.1 bromodomain family [Trichomonas vaginalis G3]|eukprot:XP_001580971.1 hypothetical protein [Trichomonas vaginalis G3]